LREPFANCKLCSVPQWFTSNFLFSPCHCST
jgi:hypothetical protein